MDNLSSIFKYSPARHAPMLKLLQVGRARPAVAPLAVLGAVFALGMFVAGLDNGHLAAAFAPGTDPAFVHELTHDLRHAAGFPCH